MAEYATTGAFGNLDMLYANEVPGLFIQSKEEQLKYIETLDEYFPLLISDIVGYIKGIPPEGSIACDVKDRVLRCINHKGEEVQIAF